MRDADRGQANFKSGGFVYISKEGNGQFTEVLVADKLNSTTSKRAVVAVPCRAENEIPPDNPDLSCISVVDAEKPDRYLRHLDGDLIFESESAPRNPETFDGDASFIRRRSADEAFLTIESLNKRGHYIVSSASGTRVSLSELQDPENSKEANVMCRWSNRNRESYFLSVPPLCVCLSDMDFALSIFLYHLLN